MAHPNDPVLFGSAFFTDIVGVHAIFGIVSPTVGVFTLTNPM